MAAIAGHIPSFHRGRSGYTRKGSSSPQLGIIAAAATFLMLLAMTLGTALGMRAVLRSQSEDRFSDAVESASNSVRADLDRSFTELAAIEAFVKADPGLTNEQFLTFASAVNQRSASSQALGYAPLVRASESDAFFASLEERGLNVSHLRDGALRAQAFPVAYTFPPITGLVEIGADIGADPRFGSAIAEARRTRLLVASAPTAPQTNPSGQPWMLVFLPVFGAPGAGQLPSEGPLLGYAFGVYRADDFLATPLDAAGLGDIPLLVFDRTSAAESPQVFPQLVSGVYTGVPSGWTATTVEFASRRWELQFETPEQFGLSALERNVWVIVLSAGLGLTVFASISMFSLVRARMAAHSDLDMMTSQTRVIVDSAVEAIVVVDRGNRLVWANQSYADAFGMGESHLLAGKDWTAVRESAGVEFASREALLSRLAEISSSRTMAATAEDVRIKAPSERILSMTSSPVNDDAGEYLGRLFVFRDVTSERTAEASKSEFISMVSHELRTPLTSMVGYIDLLMDDAGGPLSLESRRLLGIVRRNGNRLAHLVSDILDLSRLDSMRFQLEPRRLSLAGLLEELAESMAGEFRAKKQIFGVQIAPKLPDVDGDRERLAQVFTNLLANAYRYTPEGGEVSLKAREAGGRVEVTVTDSGIGIRPEDQARIFDRFVRIQRGGTRPQGSTGLGLAITRGLVELHGGSISVSSQPGAGSTFAVTLPAARGEVEAA
jgi:PAS domain S-box-containing protein